MNPPNKLRRPLVVCALLFICACLSAHSPARAQGPNDGRTFGDVQVLATVPFPPGFPEGIAVNGNKAYVAGPASFATAGTPPSQVFAYDTSTGALERTYTMQGELTQFPHANSCIAFDGAGQLYVVNLQLGIVRLDTGSGAQTSYAPPLPDLPACSASPAPCSPTFFDLPALPNDIAFDEAGNLYETDSFQATIWRIPAGGGQPQIWFQDSRLDTPFGANGLRLSPDRTKIYFTVTADGVDMFGNFLGGKVYTLPLVDAPAAADLQIFHQYNGDAPDGIAFGRTGKLYVVLAAPFNSGVSILRPDGTQETRLGNTGPDPTFPYDSPANAAFDKHGALLLTNHAFATMNPAHFTLLSVFVDDKESPLVRPNLP
ncbi:MAG: SMP-30/gluconolactonase/LRE family protein [Pyrinomonadaceae bacterium]